MSVVSLPFLSNALENVLFQLLIFLDTKAIFNKYFSLDKKLLKAQN